MPNYKINNFIDQVFFCTIGLTANADFDQHTDFNPILSQQNWQAGKLSDALLALDDASWQAITPT